MAKNGITAATKALQQELKSLQKEPLEGFTVQLINDNLFEWEVAIFGPPNTLYQGGYFKSHIKFPQDYPYAPPSVRFTTKMWHPNIYENGDVCISILHPPVDDPTNTELPSEKWNPAQNVRTVMMSIISLLNEPNTYSPANVDASVMYRRYVESKGVDKEYENIIRKQVLATLGDAERDGVVVPQTLEEYCVKTTGSGGAYSGGIGCGAGAGDPNDDCILDDLDDLDPYDNDDDVDEDDDDDEDNNNNQNDSDYAAGQQSNTDSGNEES